MNDLERDLRTLFDEKSGAASFAPKPPSNLLRRARARQLRTAIVGGLGVAAIIVGSIAGIRALVTADGTTPADQPTETTTMNGVSITHPADWAVIDPDAAGLNGPGPETFPRLILALSPFDPGDMLGCPGMADGIVPTSLLTIQEEPLAMTGGSASPWPAELQPLFFESAGTTGAVAATGGCYPGWEFLRAGWTASDRTFEARVGFAADITEEDRQAVLDAFASMTFEPGDPDGPVEAMLDEGEIGGESWRFSALRDGGLQLSIDTPDSSTGTGGFEGTPGELQWTEQPIGDGADARVLVFGVVPKRVVRLETAGDAPDSASVLEIPDEISDRFDAFLLVMEPGRTTSVAAVTADGEVIAMSEITAGSREPAETPIPLPEEVLPEHGGTYWGLYLAVAESLDEAELDEAVRQAELIGYTPAIGEIACDDAAAMDLGLREGLSGVAIYFATREDAEAAAALFDSPPVGIAEVTTYCLD